MFMRWITLLIILINVSFNYIFTLIAPQAKQINEVSDQYNTLFVPAGYAFSIWGIIYLAAIVYGIVQLLPAHKNNKVYEQLNPGFILLNTAGILWIAVFRFELIALSAVMILIMLASAIALFIKAHKAIRYGNHSYWLAVPFSLYMAWLSVASMSNISVWLLTIHFSVTGISGSTWVIVLLAAALALGWVTSIGYKDAVYPLVIAWASYAIWVALHRKEASASSIQFAMAVAILTIIAAILAVVLRIKAKHIKRPAAGV